MYFYSIDYYSILFSFYLRCIYAIFTLYMLRCIYVTFYLRILRTRRDQAQRGLPRPLPADFGIYGRNVHYNIYFHNKIPVCSSSSQKCRGPVEITFLHVIYISLIQRIISGSEKSRFFRKEQLQPIYLLLPPPTFGVAVFFGSNTAWMLGSTPPCAIVTPDNSLFSSSSFLIASCR
jgi:hypothetical protein